jgi:hypothetical protein
MTLCLYKGNFKITHYCKACNDPPGSTETASGEEPIKNGTCALDYSLYQKYKGCYLNLEWKGMYFINDFHRRGKSIVDIYNGDCDECECDYCSDNDEIIEGGIITD